MIRPAAHASAMAVINNIGGSSPFVAGEIDEEL
jgi:hypothetical protein